MKTPKRHGSKRLVISVKDWNALVRLINSQVHPFDSYKDLAQFSTCQDKIQKQIRGYEMADKRLSEL